MADEIHAQTLKLLDELKAIQAVSSSPSDAMAAMKPTLDTLLEMYADVHAAVHGEQPAEPDPAAEPAAEAAPVAEPAPYAAAEPEAAPA